MFWLKVYNIFTVEIGSYFHFILSVILLNILFKINKIVTVTVVFVFILITSFYSVAYNLKFNECASYFTFLLNLCLAIFILPRVSFDKIHYKSFRKIVTYSTLLFITFYELSHPFAKDRSFSDDYFGNSREYREGFVISHTATYYLGVLGFILFLMNRKILALAVWLYVYILGARIGLVYIFSSVIVIVLNQVGLYIKLKKISLLFFSLLLITIITICININKYFGFDQLNVFTSGRAKIWTNALVSIREWDFQDFLLGMGPKQSIVFNDRVSNIAVWMHNDFLDIFYNLGFIGLCIFFCFLISFIKSTRSVFFVLVFVFASFLNGFFLYDPVFFLTIVCLLNSKFRRELPLIKNYL